MTRTVRYLPVDPDDVIVHRHAPGDGAAGPSVLLLPPFGWDDVSSHRARRAWADDLAARGSLAVRLDLPGTGDSAGEPTDPGRLDAWVAAVAAAAAHARELRPEQRVVALGLGLGGLLAWTATAGGAAVDDLILWGVPARGRTLVRELKAFAALKNDEWGDGPPPPGAHVPDDGFDVTGYLITDATAAALSAVDLTQLAMPQAARRRVLLLGRDGLPVDARLAAVEGPEVQVADGPGWGAMTANPQDAVAPVAVFARVREWLAEAAAAPLTPVPSDAPAVRERLELPGATESPWLVRRAFGEQFGVLTRPESSGGPAPLGVLLLNGGAVRHTGPNRMWVEAARRWAADGVPVLRLDTEGLGDSDGDERPYVDSARLYTPALSVQALQAAEDLVADGVAERWLLIGLCAGAFWAFHGVVDGGSAIPAAALVNPFALHWEDELVGEAEVSAAARLRTADGWKRLLSGGVPLHRVRGAGRALLTRRARQGATNARLAAERADLDRLRAQDKQLTLLIGQGEPIYARFEREGTLATFAAYPNVDVRRLPGRDHTFRAPWQQRTVHAELDRFLADERHRAAATAAGE